MLKEILEWASAKEEADEDKEEAKTGSTDLLL